MQMLVALNHSFDRRSRDLLIFLRSTDGDGISRPYSADGVATFAPLLATGWPRRSSNRAAAAGGRPPFAVFEVGLTDRGRALLRAWETGDDSEYRQALEGS
jgi:hypothetical protein